MSYVVYCDNNACERGHGSRPARAIAAFDEREKQPTTPPGWHEWVLDDWKAHGCCDACFEIVKHERQADTPFTSTAKGIRVETPPRPIQRPAAA